MIHDMSIRFSFFAILALLAGPLRSQETTVWRIGTFDHASAEFTGRVGTEAVVVDAEDEDGLGRPLRPDLGVDVRRDRAGVLVSGVGDDGSHYPAVVRSVPRRKRTGPPVVGEARFDLSREGRAVGRIELAGHRGGAGQDRHGSYGWESSRTSPRASSSPKRVRLAGWNGFASPYRGITWKCTWNTIWPARAPALSATL